VPYFVEMNKYSLSSETDLSEVLQIEQVFTNVSKGAVAKRDEWEKAFNTTEMSKVVEEVSRMLTYGERVLMVDPT
jgi:ribosome maturation protein SDO1